MKHKIFKQYVVDAFTDQVFQGNPAAVCVLEAWPEDQVMQQIAQENRLSETAFTVKQGKKYGLRWFTPGGEIDLCGHATLGTAYVLSHFVEKKATELVFVTKSGKLTVTRDGDLFTLDMPAYELKSVPVTKAMTEAIGVEPKEAYMGRELVCVLETAEQVKKAQPDPEKVKKLDGLLLHLTAPGKKYDCVTRSFAPKLEVIEDPVCGSGHCHVVPLWAKKLDRKKLVAFQASQRTGVLYCHLKKDRVLLSGKGALYSRGEIYLPIK